MTKHKNQTKSKRSSRNVSRKGSRMPSVAKSRKSHKKTPLKSQRNLQATVKSSRTQKELKQVFFTVDQDLNILKILQQGEGRSRTPKKTRKIKKGRPSKNDSVSQKRKVELQKLAQQIGMKYQKVLSRSNMLQSISEKTLQKLEDTPKVCQQEQKKHVCDLPR